MKISSAYRNALEIYLEWEDVLNPASGTFQDSCMESPDILEGETGLSAAEGLCLWESRGKASTVRSNEWPLLRRYLKGKRQRDWWSKEIGWWNKWAPAYMPEEFLGFLGPLPFIELFGRSPITRLVRYFYDNHYSLWEFRLDSLMLLKAGEWKMSYYEREDRDSALRNAWRQIKVKWISPAIYRIRRKILKVGSHD